MCMYVKRIIQLTSPFKDRARTWPSLPDSQSTVDSSWTIFFLILFIANNPAVCQHCIAVFSKISRWNSVLHLQEMWYKCCRPGSSLLNVHHQWCVLGFSKVLQLKPNDHNTNEHHPWTWCFSSLVPFLSSPSGSIGTSVQVLLLYLQ